MSRRRAVLRALVACAVAVSAEPVILATASLAATGQSVVGMTFLGKDREPGGEPNQFVGVGLPGEVKFFDGDLPPDLVRWGVRVSSTSDPVGLLVPTRREMRASASYRGEFRFSTTGTNQAVHELLVADGDTVTFSYLDAATNSGEPRTVEVTTTWRSGSAQPDSRSLIFSTADPEAPVVLGEYHAVAPSATVRVYASSIGGTTIGTAQADAKGAFSVRVPRVAPVPTTLWVAASEGGGVESRRVAVHRALVTGRVLYPEPRIMPVSFSAVWIRPPGTAKPCPACVVVSASSYRGGRFAAVVNNSSSVTSTGPYDVDALPGGGDPVFPSPWVSGAFGTSPIVRTTVADMEITADVGDIVLRPPNLLARVLAAGLPVPEADFSVESPDGARLAGGGYTRADGRIALFLPDGDYRLWVRPPFRCAGYRDQRTGIISVRDSMATPAAMEVDLGPGSGAPGTVVRVPVVGGSPLELELTAPAALVGLLVDATGDEGYVSAGCRSTPVPPGITPVGPGVQLDTPGLDVHTARVCLGYTYDQVAAAGVDPARLELFHVSGDRADVVTTGRDAGARRVCGATTSLSGFVLGVPNNGPTPTSTSTTTTTATTGPSSSTTTTTTPRTAPPALTPRPVGYWMVGGDGAVYAFGGSAWLGAPALGVIAVDLEPTPTGRGYWIVSEGGDVHPFGDAVRAGQASGLARDETVTSLSATPSGRGYWLFTTLGRAMAFGDAAHLGDMGGVRLNGPVFDSVPTPSGHGYYMVASDGGIFAFGDAAFRGSMGAARLNAPVQSLVPDSDGDGYWLVASDGGVFAFSAPFRGSMGAARLNGPVTGMVRYGNGYLMVGSDGGIFNFSDRPFLGSLGDRPPARPIVSVASLP